MGFYTVCKHLSNTYTNPFIYSSAKVRLLFHLACVATANITFASLAASDSDAVVATSYRHPAYVILLIILAKQCNGVKDGNLSPLSSSGLNAWKWG